MAFNKDFGNYRMPSGALVLLLIFSLVLWILVSVDMGYRITMNSQAIEWSCVDGLVTDVKTKDKSAEVCYKYEFLNRRFSGNRYTFLPGGSISERDEILSKYNSEDEVEVRVNPSNQQQSVLVIRKTVLPYIENELLALAVFSALIVGVMTNLVSRRK